MPRGGNLIDFLTKGLKLRILKINILKLAK